MINVDLINPYVRVGMRSILAKGTVIKQRAIFDYELIYVERGEMKLNYDGVPCRCTEGQFVFIRPGICHSIDCSEGEVSQPHIHFDLIYDSDSGHIPVSFKDISDMTAEERKMIRPDAFPKCPVYPTVTFRDTNGALAYFYNVIDRHTENMSLAAKGSLVSLISMIIKDNFPFSAVHGESPADGRIPRQIKDYIDSTDGVGIDLESLEKQFAYSRFHLERLFKPRYGVSLIAYANDKRMERAKRLLADGSVSRAAQELGYTSIYAFSRAFKRACGYSPSSVKGRD